MNLTIREMRKYMELETYSTLESNKYIKYSYIRKANDYIRNKVYQHALEDSIVKDKHTILNIGSGFGLMIYYAGMKRAMITTGLEKNILLAKISREILRTQKMHNPVFVVNRNPHYCTYSHVGGKRHLMVNEEFDEAIFGDDILLTMFRAYEHFMSENAIVLPRKAELFIAGAQSKQLNSRYRLNNNNALYWKKDVRVSNKIFYDGVDVNQVKDLNFVTEVETLIRIDFNDLEDIMEKLNKAKIYGCNLEVTKNGRIDVFVCWFDLYITDNLKITTNPNNEKKTLAWPQAVFFNHVPLDLVKGDVITPQFVIDNKLKLIDGEDLNTSFITKSMMRFLNDTEYTKLMESSIPAICLHMCNIIDITEIVILDLSPFPIIGFHLLKRGAKKLFFTSQNDIDRSFIEMVFRYYSVEENRYTHNAHFPVFNEVGRFEKYHIIITDFIKLDGSSKSFIGNRSLYSEYEKFLQDGGIILPDNITFEAKIISSDWLDKMSRVDNDNLDACEMASFINKHLLGKMVDVDLSTLEYTSLSKYFDIWSLTEPFIPLEIGVQCEEAGQISGILTRYNIDFFLKSGSIVTDRLNSFANSVIYIIKEHNNKRLNPLDDVSVNVIYDKENFQFTASKTEPIINQDVYNT